MKNRAPARLPATRADRRCSCGVVLLGLVLTLLPIDLITAAEPTPTFPPGQDLGQDTRIAVAKLSRVVGHKACLDCHKSETAAMLRTQHGRSLDKLQAAPNSKLYASKLGIDVKEIAESATCTSCHATRQETPAQGVRAIASISCESCHGPAGGENGWLNHHAVYGPKGTKIDDETEAHRVARQQLCDAAGMVRASNLYEIARNCLGCHIVPNETLVNQGGHKADYQFDLVGRSQGEVRHNFHLDQSSNSDVPTLLIKRDGIQKEHRHRMMFIMGKMAELELSLHNLATVTEGAEREQYAKDMGVRATQARDALEEVMEVIEDASGNVPEELEQILDAVEGVKLKRRLNREELAGAAESVGAAARSFTANHDGKQLAAIDELLPTRPNGTVYQP